MSEFRFASEEMMARGYEPEIICEAERVLKAREVAQQLIGKIEIAFRNVPRPRITRSVAKGYDYEWVLSEERIQELAAADKETEWREVSDDEIESCQECFTFADAEGCRFYFPAYILHYLKEFPCSSYDAVYWACTQPEKLQALNEAQRACIDEFLTLCHKYQRG